MKNKPSSGRARKRLNKHLEQINLYAAGIDIGSESHYVAVPEGLDDEPVRRFCCFTGDLERMADWLVRIGIQTVAMESTGIYWIPCFEILEERGLEVLLVNARHVKNVSGRKSDVSDCQWLQQLHTYGLLSGAFRPEEQVTALRAYMRQRETLVRYASSHIQHMQKALRQMNLLLDNVVTDITGKTGMSIIRAIVEGERDPDKLAAYRDPRCRKSVQEIARSLKGHYREEHLFALRQSVELYDSYLAQIRACDEAIERQLSLFDAQGDPDQLPVNKKKSALNAPAFDVRSELYRMCGVDLTAIDGVSDITALKVIAETGTDMSRWKNEKHFASWLGLSPGNKISGGKILSSKTKPTANRAAAALRMAAFALSNSQSALGAYYRRMRSRHGAPKAITATAHKLARLIYSMLKHGTEYVDQGQDYYEQQYKERLMKNLKRKAAQLGFVLVPSSEDDGVVTEISMA
ncbi:MAG TPA: IS110 family transposase [Rhodobacteraceae bacterium]|nr:IS110 family transposase [Paracoccaceae bacterium]